jgi:uncharacterized membrane protein
MPFCSQCGADVGGASFCPQCGAAAEVDATAPPTADSTGSPPTSSGAGAAQPPPAAAAASGSQDNLMGALAYVTFIPAIIFLLIEPYKNIKFVRFHAFQSIFLCVASIAISITLTILTIVLAFVGVGALVGMVGWLVQLGIFVLWIIVIIKAYGGERYKLPIIGDLAEKQA